jgi:hypothetical protein
VATAETGVAAGELRPTADGGSRRGTDPVSGSAFPGPGEAVGDRPATDAGSAGPGPGGGSEAPADAVTRRGPRAEPAADGAAAAAQKRAEEAKKLRDARQAALADAGARREGRPATGTGQAGPDAAAGAVTRPGLPAERGAAETAREKASAARAGLARAGFEKAPRVETSVSELQEAVTGSGIAVGHARTDLRAAQAAGAARELVNKLQDRVTGLDKSLRADHARLAEARAKQAAGGAQKWAEDAASAPEVPELLGMSTPFGPTVMV